MKRALLLLTLVSARADFSDDQFPQQPEILTRLITSAQASGEPLASTVIENTAYYLRRAEYIGSCETPFGRVHVAELFFIRSAPKGSKLPARGDTFVVFFDASLSVRARWDLERFLPDFALERTKLLLDRETLFDFAHPPATTTVLIDGKLQKVPQWTPTQ